MNFARTAMALPKDGDGPRWRASVPAIITLQAVSFALTELEMISKEERPLAMDRAEILIHDAIHQLDEAWASEPRSDSLTDLVDDALTALATARNESNTNENPRSIDRGLNSSIRVDSEDQ